MQAAAYSTVITGEVKTGIFSSAVNLQPQSSHETCPYYLTPPTPPALPDSYPNMLCTTYHPYLLKMLHRDGDPVCVHAFTRDRRASNHTNGAWASHGQSQQQTCREAQGAVNDPHATLQIQLHRLTVG